MKKITNPIKAIRSHCIECFGGSYKEIEGCTSPNCALYPFRFGKNPYRKKVVLSDERKKKMAENLARHRNTGD